MCIERRNMSKTITATLQKITRHPSKYGGDFYYLFFKDLEDGKTYRSCVSPSYRNWRNWQEIVEGFDEKTSPTFTGLILKGNLVDADSVPQKVVNG